MTKTLDENDPFNLYLITEKKEQLVPLKIQLSESSEPERKVQNSGRYFDEAIIRWIKKLGCGLASVTAASGSSSVAGNARRLRRWGTPMVKSDRWEKTRNKFMNIINLGLLKNIYSCSKLCGDKGKGRRVIQEKEKRMRSWRTWWVRNDEGDYDDNNNDDNS